MESDINYFIKNQCFKHIIIDQFLDQDLLCQKGKGVMIKAVQCEGGHLYCLYCSQNMELNDDKYTCAEKDCGKFQKFSIINKALENCLQNQKVRCINSEVGCSFQGKFKDMLVHFDSCQQIQCYFCKKSISEENLSQHMYDQQEDHLSLLKQQDNQIKILLDVVTETKDHEISQQLNQKNQIIHKLKIKLGLSQLNDNEDNLQKIINELEKLEIKQDSNDINLTEVKHPRHPHILKRVIDNSQVSYDTWNCDGIFWDIGCKSEIQGINVKNGKRFHCSDCNYDLCELCLENKQNNNEKEFYYNKKHSCPLTKSIKNTGWACDAIYFREKCKQNITGFHQTFGMVSYSCMNCDFDLCQLCFEYYNSI